MRLEVKWSYWVSWYDEILWCWFIPSLFWHCSNTNRIEKKYGIILYMKINETIHTVTVRHGSNINRSRKMNRYLIYVWKEWYIIFHEWFLLDGKIARHQLKMETFPSRIKSQWKEIWRVWSAENTNISELTTVVPNRHGVAGNVQRWGFLQTKTHVMY